MLENLFFLMSGVWLNFYKIFVYAWIPYSIEITLLKMIHVLNLFFIRFFFLTIAIIFFIPFFFFFFQNIGFDISEMRLYITFFMFWVTFLHISSFLNQKIRWMNCSHFYFSLSRDIHLILAHKWKYLWNIQKVPDCTTSFVFLQMPQNQKGNLSNVHIMFQRRKSSGGGVV